MMTKTKTIYGSVVLGVSCLCAAVHAEAEAPAPNDSAFKALCDKLTRQPEAATDAEATTLLQEASTLGRPLSATVAMKAYLTKHPNTKGALLLGSAEVAQLAGDYRAAVTRYKTYLEAPENPAGASRAAAQIYEVLIDFLHQDEEAYQFMRNADEQTWQSPQSKRFSRWLLDQTVRRRDFTPMSKCLLRVMSEKVPLEQERLYYWDILDWMTQELSRADSEKFEALPTLTQIVPLIREGGNRNLRMAMFLANLQRETQKAGKDPVKDKEALKQSYAPVLQAAKTYFDAGPSAGTFRDILWFFGGGIKGFDGNIWNDQIESKQEFMFTMLQKLTDADRNEVIPQHQGHASPDQWLAFAVKFPQYFVNQGGARSINFYGSQPKDLESCKKASSFLQGVPTYGAAIFNSLAAGPDFEASALHFLKNEMWYLTPHESMDLLRNNVWAGCSNIAQTGGKPLPGDLFDKTFVKLGPEYVVHTPVAIYSTGWVSEYLRMAWSYSGADPNDKSKFDAILHSLDWVHYNKPQIQQTFGNMHNEFKRWYDETKKANIEAKKKEELLAIGATLEKTYAQIMAGHPGDPAKAPNPLCAGLVAMEAAAEAKDQPKFVAAARDVYALIKTYNTTKIPYGRFLFSNGVFANRSDRFDLLDFRCEALAEQLPLTDTPEGQERACFIAEKIPQGRPNWWVGGWDYWQAPAADKALAEKVRVVCEKPLLAQLDKGTFWPPLMNLYRSSRHGEIGIGGGSQWKNFDATGEEVFDKLLAQRALSKNHYRSFIDDWACLDSMRYMWLLQREFPKSQAKYPLRTYFDDMFIEEAKASNSLPWNYFQFGGDEKKKIMTLSADYFKAFDKVPFGKNEKTPVYNWEEFRQWHFKVMENEPAIRDAFTKQIESYFGKTRFDQWSMGWFYFWHQHHTGTPEGRTEFFEKLKTYCANVRQVGQRVEMAAMHGLGSWQNGKDFKDEELDVLVGLFSDCVPTTWQQGWSFEHLARATLEGLAAKKRVADLYKVLPHIWRISSDTNNPDLQKMMGAFAVHLQDQKLQEVATVYAVVGLTISGDHLIDEARTALQTIKSKGQGAFAQNSIPVGPADPRYVMYVAQNEFLSGKVDSPWQAYVAHKHLVPEMFKELDVSFLLWLVTKNIGEHQFEPAEELVHKMLPWFEQMPAAFDLESRARLYLYIADLYFEKQEYPKARGNYTALKEKKEFESTQSQKEAALRLAKVEMATKNYVNALSILEDAVHSRDMFLQTEGYYSMAELKNEQGDYDGAMKALEEVFSRNLEHAEARVLEANVNLRLKRFEKSTDVAVGPGQKQKFLVPGQMVRVKLEDRNLGIVGGATSVQMRFYTDSGDEEVVDLARDEDSKFRFSGQLRTGMGEPKSGDHVLQILGGEKVHYDYTEAFRKAHNLPEQPSVMDVISDAELYVSSGRILSKEELQQRQMENEIKRQIHGSDYTEDQVALSAVRDDDQIKPGNKINVRVVDFGQNHSKQKDTVFVHASTSSGDRIDQFPLTETEPYSGIFEGSIPTAGGQPTASASDSDEGKEPNDVISSIERQAWIARRDNIRPKQFWVNLNDNVALGKMTVVADVPERKLNGFMVQTSLNNKDFTTVGSWPDNITQWDGSLRAEIANCQHQPNTYSDAANYMVGGYFASKAPKLPIPIKQFAISVDGNVAGLADKLHLAWEGNYLLHLQGAFYVNHKEMKTFALDNKKRLDRMRYYFALDGVPSTAQSPWEIKGMLNKGVHVVDVFVWGWRHSGPNFDVKLSTEDAPDPVICKAEMFDPAKEPKIAQALAVAPAEIKADAEGKTFDIAFPKDTQTRIVRLVLVDFEKDAPAIKKIKLTNTKGEVILPTKEDYEALRKNQTLEILPGDRISISYKNPVPLTKGRETAERFMTATFYDAKLSACSVEFYLNGHGDREIRYIPLRRYKPGDNINIFINDPDEDTTDGKDQVKFTARAGSNEVQVTATETEEHSGVFIGNVKPVLGAPQGPEQLQVGAGDEIVISYIDRENTDPGISFARTYAIEQSEFKAPKVTIFNVDSEALSPEEIKTIKQTELANRRVLEYIPVTANLVAHRPDASKATDGAEIVSDGPLVVEVTFPSIAQTPKSPATLYIQTASGRAKYGKPPVGDFDKEVPGTLKLTRWPEPIHQIEAPPGYRHAIIRDQRNGEELLAEGKYIFYVPMELSETPKETLIGYEQPKEPGAKPLTLSVRGNDEVFVGFEYQDGQAAKWVVQKAKLKSEIAFHVMNSRYQEELSGAHVGDNLYFRIIHKTMDVSDARDSLTIQLKTKSGKQLPLTLGETYAHSGIFKGMIKLVYIGDKQVAEDPNTLAVDYGDELTATYAGGKEATVRTLQIFKGSNGRAIPFTRRFQDPAIAVQTQFTIAEAYLELARQHRKLKQDAQAKEEMAQGKRLLEEAVRDYPYADTRTQSEYLLAELSLELAEDLPAEDEKRTKYLVEAQIRYNEIAAGSSQYAPKALFKKALISEKMNKMEDACEDYVKLSYRYPDDPLVPNTILRLGTYFRTKAQAAEQDSKAQTTDQVKAVVAIKQARELYITAGHVFSRLLARFPQHKEAFSAMMTSGFCYRDAEAWDDAIARFKEICDSKDAEKELIAEALFRTAQCYFSKHDDVNAFRTYRNVLEQFPLSDWGKRANGELLNERMIAVQQNEKRF